MLLALMLSALQTTPTTITLSRGAAVAADPNLRYWDTQDTTLEAAVPDTNFGGDLTLRGGPTRTILIRFGDLRRVIGAHTTVTGARLILTTSGGPAPTFRGMSRVLVPWGEGPMTSIVNALKGGPDPTVKSVAIPNAATWRERRGGKAAWQGPGANGGGDADSLEGATAKADENRFVISGLEKTLQGMVDHPEQNFGFSLRFDGAAEFYSAQSPSNRPVLELTLGDRPKVAGSDLSVVRIEKGASEGNETAFVAHVKNVGQAESKGFAYSWILGERPGSAVRVETKLAPGAEVTFTIRRPTRVSTDHRDSPLAFRIDPGDEDINPANNELGVFENAKFIRLGVPIGIVGPRGFNARGSESLDDWAQAQAANFNVNYLAQSRFSFALEGALERIAIQEVVPGPASDDALAMGPPTAGSGVELAWMQQFAQAVGLHRPGYAPLNPEKVAGWSLAPGTPANEDRFPGLLGYGDTRFEGFLPYAIGVPYEPVSSENRMMDLLEPTDLLSASDVATVNAQVTGVAAKLPSTILVRALDLAGHPISGGKLTFKAIAPDAKSLVDLATTASTGTTGTFLLPSNGADGPFKLGSSSMTDGLLLATLSANGQSESAWIKAWQLLDSASRGNKAVCIFDLRFNICDAELDSSVNLATDRILTDSAASDPAKLATMTDGRLETEASLGEKPGDWFEIDLGRDRTIGELDLDLGNSPFWNQFSVIGYATGQSASGQTPLIRETDFGWTRQNRGGPNGMNYRVSAVRVRYLRIVNISGGPARVREFVIRPAKIPGT